MANDLIFYQAPFIDHRDSRMFLDLNGDAYSISHDESRPFTAELAHPLESEYTGPKSDRKILRLIIWHGYNNQVNDLITWLRGDPTSYMILSGWDPNQDHERLAHVDWSFNRTKAYYSGFPFRPDVKLWYNTGAQNYLTHRPSSADKKTRIFLAPNRTSRDPARKHRWLLQTALEPWADRGHLGNYDPSHGPYDITRYLVSNREAPECDTLQEVLMKLTHDYKPKFWSGYQPVHWSYLDDTFITCYCESIESGQTLMLTEKTYDAVIRAHFILPFSAKGLMSWLTALGYRSPTFIDYSYDQIENDQDRWRAYTRELQRLLNLDMETWRRLWHENLDLLVTNQMWMYNRPYDKVNLRSLLQLD